MIENVVGIANICIVYDVSGLTLDSIVVEIVPSFCMRNEIILIYGY